MLAGKLPACAHIEVDALRYMVVGGLVAYGGGQSPAKHPEEYKRQCWLAVEHAMMFARNFAANGFSSVIEGVEDECAPGSQWHGNLRDLRVFNILMLCDNLVLQRRWQDRTGNSNLTKGIVTASEFWRSVAKTFDLVLDSSSTCPELLADRAAKVLS